MIENSDFALFWSLARASVEVPWTWERESRGLGLPAPGTQNSKKILEKGPKSSQKSES